MPPRQDYIKKMELKKQRKLEAGVVSERFPKISNIIIHMTYFHDAENAVLMERTVNVFPTSTADFNMECMIRGCDKGGFNLNPVISGLIKQNKKMAKGTMKCKGKLDHHSPNHANISYEINIKYNKNSSMKHN
jgi:hypothetical protein